MVDLELVKLLTSFNDEIKDELVIIKERLTSVENKCTVIEKEHGEKLDLLLDLAIIEGSDVYQKMIKGKGKSNLKNAIL